MKVLVTGATGFLGSHLVRRLVELGDQVRCLVRRSRCELPRGTEWANGNILEPESLLQAMKGCRVVYHCAGLVSDYKKREELFKTNVEGVQNVIEAAKRVEVRRLIHVSTCGVLGCINHKGTNEFAPMLYSGDAYRDSKVEAEKLVRKGMYSSFATIVRPGWIYGPGERRLLPQLLDRLLSGRMFVVAGGRKLVHPTFVKHVVYAMIAAAEQPEAAGETYNITDGLKITMKEFLQAFARVAGVNEHIRSIPYPLALVGAGIGSLFESVFHKSAPINLWKLKLLMTDFHFSIDKAKRQLNYSPKTTLEQGLAAFVREYNTQSGKRVC